MSNSSTEKHWKITATINTALCIGDSGGSETGADKATVKTSDGKLYIPASTLKGIWRHACEVIAPSMGSHSICNSPRAESMCVNNHCIICQIFGSPTLSSRIFISDLTMDTEMAAGSTEIRNGVTINRQRRVAVDQRLYFTETSLPNALTEFSGEVTIEAKITDEQIKLLKAGLKYIHAIGSGKSRGLGWLHIDLAEKTPETKKDPSIKQNDDDFTEIKIEVTLQSSIVPGGRKSRGQATESVQNIRGGLLRGAVANAWMADSNNSGLDADFNRLFLSDAAAIFRNCYPGTNVLPATALACKDFSGFLTPDDKEKHGIFDTLLERLVAEKAGWLYNPSCPHCEGKGRVEAQSGFYAKPNDIYKKKTLNTRLLTRVAINRQRKVAADELLYHLNAIDHLSSDSDKSKNIKLYGSARIPSALVCKVADTLQKQVERLGSGSSRGLGRVNVNVANKDDTDTLEKRINDFNTALQKIWNTYSQLPNVNIGSFEGTYFSIALQSDAVLVKNWQSSMVLTAQMLQTMADCTAAVKLIRSFASYDYTSGWNAAWRLPKETDLVSRIGSIFVFHTANIDSWFSALKTLENIGIGKRREEGFGQILICDPFHLRSREQVKSEGTWLKNKEE